MMGKAFQRDGSERGDCRPSIGDCLRSTSGTGTGEAGASPLPYVQGLSDASLQLQAVGTIGQPL
jgi:hypothetical protein